MSESFIKQVKVTLKVEVTVFMTVETESDSTTSPEEEAKKTLQESGISSWRHYIDDYEFDIISAIAEE